MRLIALLAALMPPSSGAAQTAGAGDYIAEAERQFRVDARCPPQEEGEEIVVCGRRLQDPERYRLPIRPDGFDPKGGTDSISRERHKLVQEGDAGVGSCSTVGPGGWTGCFHRNTKRRCEQETCGFGF